MSIGTESPPAEQPEAPAEQHVYASLFAELLEWLDVPMAILGMVWLVLLVLELTVGLHPVLAVAGVVIWAIFIVEFTLEIALAPDHALYLRRNWLTAIALLLPALRVFQAFRALRALRSLRAARGLRLLRIVSSMNRGMSALRRSLARRGVGYVALLTVIVLGAGAAGMYALEGRDAGSAGFGSYSESLYWTAMLLTTAGSEFWPQTAEGRLLSVLLSMYAIGVFGYIAATLATFLIGRDAESDEGEIAGEDSLRALRDEVAALRTELQRRNV